MWGYWDISMSVRNWCKTLSKTKKVLCSTFNQTYVLFSDWKHLKDIDKIKWEMNDWTCREWLKDELKIVFLACFKIVNVLDIHYMQTKKGNTFAQISLHAFTFNSFVSMNFTCFSFIIRTTLWLLKWLFHFIWESVQCVL